ncbi:1-aminocyclopropane-1-carboxylate oxidase homolog 1-like [Syzygium oleosum]|uniref:1-aminocyclopropane-1-carboxylate oxidase homolog 1-like n=1 Tax=Syzygium oleosum TaxID=219896 RepID=UPI0024B87CCC|nr:1-aminocyclopropane-1-carboxylate oxidase homolog 1-like [Syzygium oleosum]
MEVFSTDEANENKQKYDRTCKLKAFDESKAGVKGLVDAGITEVPPIFVERPENLRSALASGDSHFRVPIIDLEDIAKDPSRRQEVVNEVRSASKTWGFFQVVNHGIPTAVLEEMLDGVRRFHELDAGEKRRFYSRDFTRGVAYHSNFNLYRTEAANWRDTLFCIMAPNAPVAEDLPAVCRDIMLEFSKQVMNLGITLFELLSEALGLNPNHLKDMDCAEGLVLLSQYYPKCPQPELTLGTSKHADSDFFTVLLQDHVGGLQVLHQNQWIDVSPVPGALVVNIGDLLQLISNDIFKSAEHRVLANNVGPRVSVACFFYMAASPSPRLYGPIKELISEGDPPKYRETTIMEYVSRYSARGDETSALQMFKL